MRASSRKPRAGPILALLCATGLVVPSDAQEPKALKTLVRLVEADSANETWSSTVQPGLAIPLQLRVLEAAPEQARQAELAVTPFSAQPPAVGSVPATIRLAGSTAGGRRVMLTLDAPRWVDAELFLDKLRPGTTYKGRLALSAGSLYHTWEITLVTPGQGSLSAETISPTKLVTIPPCRWMLVRRLFQGCDSTGRDLSFTLTNRSEAPFSRVRVRFEPSGAPATKSTASNFSIDSFSFWSQGKRVDLENRSGETNIQIAPQQQLTLAARVEPLSPGEYAGAFRFGAAEVTGEAQEPNPWASDLTKASDQNALLDDLFRMTDLKAWEYLDTAAKNSELTLERAANGNEKPEAYDLVILHLTSRAKHLDDRRLVFHPLHVVWRVALSDGNARSAVTPGLRLMQYFPTPGKVEVTARLRWDGREIPIKDSIGLDVLPDQKYRLRGVLADWTEYAVIVLGAGFATATGISSLYDATFGSFGQYLALLSWAAGAGTGGNLFKELGTTSTAGGRADAALPTAAAGASR